MSFSTGIWKPGDPKPSQNPGAGTKRARSVEAAPTRTAQLSGATRNMRFMQRHHSQSPQPAQHAPRQRAQRSSQNLSENRDCMELSSNHDHNVGHTPLAASDSPDESFSTGVLVERASSLDMYGRDQCLLLGRRSFGGFNPITSENLYSQQATLDGRRPKQSTTVADTESEQKLMQKYKDLARGRNVNERKTHSNNNSNHKKASGISNQRKRMGGLDDMMID
jgi:hypothetical protein